MDKPEIKIEQTADGLEITIKLRIKVEVGVETPAKETRQEIHNHYHYGNWNIPISPVPTWWSRPMATSITTTATAKETGQWSGPADGVIGVG